MHVVCFPAGGFTYGGKFNGIPVACRHVTRGMHMKGGELSGEMSLTVRRLFNREVAALMALQDPHVLVVHGIYDENTKVFDGSGTSVRGLMLVQERAGDQSIADYAADRNVFTRVELNRCFLEIVNGLAALHEAK